MKETLKGENLEAMKADTEALTTASHKLAEAMYAKAAADAQAQETSGEGPSEDSGPEPSTDETVIDVEAEEVTDEEDTN